MRANLAQNQYLVDSGKLNKIWTQSYGCVQMTTWKLDYNLNSFNVVLKAIDIQSVHPITTKVRLGAQRFHARNNQSSRLDSRGGSIHIHRIWFSYTASDRLHTLEFWHVIRTF